MVLHAARRLIARRGLRGAMIVGAAFCCAWALMQTPLFTRLELQLCDAQARLFARYVDFGDIVLVDVTEDSLRELAEELGAWPYQRGVYAKITDFLRQAGAASITYDIVFSESRIPAQDAELARAIARTPRVVLAAHALNGQLAGADNHVERLAWKVGASVPAKTREQFVLPNQRFVWANEQQIASVGIITLDQDSDGLLRRVPLLHRAHGHVLPSLSLATLVAHDQPAQVSYDALAQVMHIGNRQWPIDADASVLLRFPKNINQENLKKWTEGHGYNFHDVYRAAMGAEFAKEIAKAVRGKKIFIGSSAWTFSDFQNTIFGPVPGLVLLAVFDGLLERGEVLSPSHKLGDGLLVALALALPWWSFRERVAQTPLYLAVGLLAAPLAILALSSLLYYFKQASAIALPLLTGFLAFCFFLAGRLLKLYHDRQRLFYEKLAAEDAYQLKSQFISHMTHELRTPLAAIMGFNRLLGEADHSDKHRPQYARVIENNSQHLMTLINNMLDQSKIEAGQMRINKAPANVREIVDDVIATLSNMAAEKRLELKALYRDNLPASLEIDPLRLRQVMLNLIGNAIKFTSQGKVHVSVEWVDGLLKIVVLDTGIGIGPHEQERIFSPFKQGAENMQQRYGGTGLGLTISRNLCKLMGGTLQLESKLGQGSVFFAAIPAARQDVEASTAPLVPPTDLQRLQGQVLLADDNNDIRDLLTRMLTKLGLRVTAVTDGRQAVAAALQTAPDLVLMDIEMPVMDGLAAVRELRAQGFDRPILAMTAHPEGPEVAQALQEGFDGYLEKPVNSDRLTRLLAGVLRPSAPESLLSSSGST